MRMYDIKRPAQLAAAIQQQARFAKAGDPVPQRLVDMDFAKLEVVAREQLQLIDPWPGAFDWRQWDRGIMALKARPTPRFRMDDNALARELVDFAPVAPVEKPADKLVRLLAAQGQSLMYYEGGSVEEFKFLGAGCYAAAFQHPTDRHLVIKVGRSSDDGWLGYAKWCTRNQHLSMVPKICELRRIVGVEGVAYIAVLEKLSPLVENDRGWGSGRSAAAEYWSEQLRQLRVFVTTGCDESCIPDSRKLEQLGRALHAAFGSNSMDLHTGNAMLNSAGELVITDPYTQSDGTTSLDLPT